MRIKIFKKNFHVIMQFNVDQYCFINHLEKRILCKKCEKLPYNHLKLQ